MTPGGRPGRSGTTPDKGASSALSWMTRAGSVVILAITMPDIRAMVDSGPTEGPGAAHRRIDDERDERGIEP